MAASVICRKLKRAHQEKVCRLVYNKAFTAECTPLNGSWPDRDDPRWDSADYSELFPDWLAINATNYTQPVNDTTYVFQGSSVGFVVKEKM